MKPWFILCLFIGFSGSTCAETVPNYNFINQLRDQFVAGIQNNASVQNLEFALSQKERSYRESKLFPLFTIIKFTNAVCRTSSEELGVCYTKSQCAKTGGMAQGNCAQGLGVCCRFIVTCGAIVTQNGTSFQNPGYPSKYTPNDGSNVCQLRIRKPRNVCQLRINFVNFDIEPPQVTPNTAGGQQQPTNDAGMCKMDFLAITSSGGTVPGLCGNLNNQHIYVEFGSSDTITLNMMLSGNSQRERQWNMELLMIPCTSLSRAPSGCLQYFTGISGQVESFNYQGGMHLANMDYSVCIRPEDGMRFIDWTACSPGEVKISGGTAPAANPASMPPCISSITGGTVTAEGAAAVDFLIIQGGVQFPPMITNANPATGAGLTAMSSITDRFCDVSWPTTVPSAYVRSSVRPFKIHFRTDARELQTTAGNAAQPDASQGFCLRWQQNPQ